MTDDKLEDKMLETIASMLNEVRHTADMIGDVTSQDSAVNEDWSDEDQKQAENMLQSAEELIEEARKMLTLLSKPPKAG